MNNLKRIYLGIIIAILYAPILVLIAFSFNSSKTTSWQGFTLDWYTQIMQNSSLQSALQYTLIVALVSSIISTIIGIMAAIVINKLRGVKRRLIMAVTYIPLLSPDIVIGISLMMLYSTLQIPFGLTTLILSHITFSTPYVILSIMPRLMQLNPNMYEAALDVGATPFYAFRKVILPDIMPGVIAGAFIAFTMSIDDFVVSFFNTASGVNTLSIQIYSMARRGVSPEINAVSTLIFLVIVTILTITNIKASRKVRLEGGQKY
ncbi:ABC transporter permease [Candidatus Epulonipiscium viviparus]|uniref:ABC transporter permease n=1 Tax=Candidatus Epulonipiscium viviparus TaxID=420336 RepID=UPI00016C0B22|nr:ABC transporter permease subunit [Candidatus Epulopiscium viviparus]